MNGLAQPQGDDTGTVAIVPTVDVKEGFEKRRRLWLNALPHEQIIEIILKLDQHVPDDVKRSIWPDDLALQVQPDSTPTKTPPVVPIDPAIEDPVPKVPTPAPTPSDAPPTAAENATLQSVLDRFTKPQPAAPQNQSYPHQPYYAPPVTPSFLPSSQYTPPPHPYEVFVEQQRRQNQNQSHSTTTYPYPVYPYGGYQYYPPPTSTTPRPSEPPAAPPPPPTHQSTPPPSQPLFTSAPLTRHPPGTPKPSHLPGSKPSLSKSNLPGLLGIDGDGNPNGDHDLPSYEEMIVEALTDFGDPDGTAPKVLFAWMASRYPLQANFRPSASQALQKAFKRGRLEKSNEGRYRLNAAWEGGNTSRRTTRRPQSLTAGALPHPLPPPTSSQAPLMHGAAGSSSSYAHPWGTPQHPYAPTTSTPSTGAPGQPPMTTWSSAAGVQSTTNATGQSGGGAAGAGGAHPPETADETWEAAQSILQALNLLAPQTQQTSPPQPSTQPSSDQAAQNHEKGEGSSTGTMAGATSGSQPPYLPPPVIAGDMSFHFGPHTPSSSPLMQHAQAQQKEPVMASLTQPSYTDAGGAGVVASGHTVATESRAALQASLAMLAAQLADIAGADIGEMGVHYVGGGTEGMVVHA